MWGAWYVERSLDTEFFKSLKLYCTNQIKKLKVATEEEVADLINSCQDSDVDVTKQHIE